MIGAIILPSPFTAGKPPISNLLRSLSSSSSPSPSNTNASPLSRHLPPASRLFVRNLPFSAGEATLFKLFSTFGQVVEVKLAKHEETKRSKGYAFIQYSTQEDAMLAMEQMDQKRVGDRIIYAEIAKPVKNGYADYPISLGPPVQMTSEASLMKDQIDVEEC